MTRTQALAEASRRANELRHSYVVYEQGDDYIVRRLGPGEPAPKGWAFYATVEPE